MMILLLEDEDPQTAKRINHCHSPRAPVVIIAVHSFIEKCTPSVLVNE